MYRNTSNKYYIRNQPFSLVIRWNIKKRKRKRITLSQCSVSAPIDNFDRHFLFFLLYIILKQVEGTITRARNLGREREREVEFHPPPSSLFPLIWIAHIQHRTRSDAESEDRGATRPRWKLFRQKGGSIRRLISVFDPREPIETDLRNRPHPSFSNLRNE